MMILVFVMAAFAMRICESALLEITQITKTRHKNAPSVVSQMIASCRKWDFYPYAVKPSALSHK